MYMDSKHDTLVRVLQILEADLETHESDGFSDFPEYLRCTAYEYKINLNDASPSESSATIKKKIGDGLHYKFDCGSLHKNASYYSDDGAFHSTGVSLPSSTLSTSTNPDAALQVIRSFRDFMDGDTETVIYERCTIDENEFGAFSSLVLNYSYELESITNGVRDISSTMVFRAG